jgi:3-oxoacyl-[acyl-carrier protein] reductase
MLAYSASKAAVIGRTKVQGKEYAETGVTVNALAPAVIQTPMVDAMPPEQVKYMTDKIPMKRCGTLEEIVIGQLSVFSCHFENYQKFSLRW